MNIICRTYKEHDLETIKELMLELGYSVELKELSVIIKEIQKKGGEVLVSEDNNVIVGCVCVLMDARLAEGIYAEIVSLIVSEKVRGKGIGKILMKEAEVWASQRVNKIRVRANEVRNSTHTFYLNHGYSHIKTQKIFTKMV